MTPIIVYTDVAGEDVLAEDHRFIPLDALTASDSLAVAGDYHAALAFVAAMAKDGLYLLPVPVGLIRRLREKDAMREAVKRGFKAALDEGRAKRSDA